VNFVGLKIVDDKTVHQMATTTMIINR